MSSKTFPSVPFFFCFLYFQPLSLSPAKCVCVWFSFFLCCVAKSFQISMNFFDGEFRSHGIFMQRNWSTLPWCVGNIFVGAVKLLFSIIREIFARKFSLPFAILKWKDSFEDVIVWVNFISFPWKTSNGNKMSPGRLMSLCLWFRYFLCLRCVLPLMATAKLWHESHFYDQHALTLYSLNDLLSLCERCRQFFMLYHSKMQSWGVGNVW